ncbi:hypothetical protein B484DRAFT_459589 [Ochromonadaceae sp. CCMP2298]|nr:hypothetical protein B484DRAFT_459589 [Ochromonadaceae sp. CCMP2298]|mmetsp:Transcript_19676/g.42746  ORF Transcript_19676/g.42746 Transcript_19676/m.42746 type:complete len:193 (-) Transcript_19676:335-913(-)|eukprot:CAMPEP_0173354302 /NCGR_PEP_ID=MMETSP1144-20121109/17106_1 /TAXON_ID=483371 /ORGANISM="non described non described, Strain CCMP2298" /LENGTH=192 /DNA_ID=CAMNT_0014302829 /DNA_START=40 /DNA_END=618 /DNA_ORIENTATION=+
MSSKPAMNPTDSRKRPAGSGYDSTFAVMVLSSIALSVFLFQMSPGPRSESKPFDSFEDFYPFYISQHQDETCRRLHVVGTTLVLVLTALNPSVLLCGILAASVGTGACHALRGQSTGIAEMALMMCTMQLCMRKLSGGWWAGLRIPLLAYSFAWAGHFFFELNTPATFLYPAYSLGGDLRMWAEVVFGQRQF